MNRMDTAYVMLAVWTALRSPEFQRSGGRLGVTAARAWLENTAASDEALRDYLKSLDSDT